MIEIFISLESAILADFKNVFIFILASLLPKLRLVLSLRFRQKITKNRHILMIFRPNGSDKTNRNLGSNEARIKMNTFLKSAKIADSNDINISIIC